MATVDRLEKLGFKRASKELVEKEALNKKLVLAYQHFKWLTPEDVTVFNEELQKKTLKEDSKTRDYKKLVFITVANYGTVPPTDILEKMEKAIEIGCFDNFEIAKIESIKEVKDPILFGCIVGCGDRFFIAQWDDDVKFEDIVGKGEKSESQKS